MVNKILIKFLYSHRNSDRRQNPINRLTPVTHRTPAQIFGEVRCVRVQEVIRFRS